MKSQAGQVWSKTQGMTLQRLKLFHGEGGLQILDPSSRKVLFTQAVELLISVRTVVSHEGLMETRFEYLVHQGS